MAGSIITAGTTRTQAGATQITADITTVNTSTAATAGTNNGDGVALPQIGSGTDKVFLINNTANPIQVYSFNVASGTADKINGVAGATGVALPPYSAATFIEANPGAWQVLLDSPPAAGYTANAATTAATLTAASVTSGVASVDINMTGTLGAGAALTLPTVANMVASMYGPSIGSSFRMRILNTSSATFSWTVTTNTGWTLSGATQTVAQNTWLEGIVTLTSLTAATWQTVARGTYS